MTIFQPIKLNFVYCCYFFRHNNMIGENSDFVVRSGDQQVGKFQNRIGADDDDALAGIISH